MFGQYYYFILIFYINMYIGFCPPSPPPAMDPQPFSAYLKSVLLTFLNKMFRGSEKQIGRVRRPETHTLFFALHIANLHTCMHTNHYTPSIYAEGYIVFVFPFIRWYVRSFVRTSWNYYKVLRARNLSGVYLTNHSSESIHIWTIGTLEGRLSFHDSSPQGPCLGVKM